MMQRQLCFSHSSAAWLRVLLCRRRMGSKIANQHTPVMFGEVDARGGYPVPEADRLTLRDKLRIGRRAWLALPESAAELRDFYLYDRVAFKRYDVRHGDYFYLGNFPRDGGHADWVVTQDSDYEEGYSTGEFVADEASGTGIFRGVLSTRVPQNGLLVRAGYVNLRSPYALMVMGRPRPMNLNPLNCVVIRCRGDGRKYRLNLHRHPLGKLDITLFDMYTFPLYTRGGPYWTVTKIPVSKLMRNYKGRVQDKPVLNDLAAHQHLSFTLADGLDGPYRLEVDYVALYYDAQLNEKFAYEVYPVSSLMKNNVS